MMQGEVFRRSDLIPTARPEIIDQDQDQDQDQGQGADSNDFLVRLDSILKTMDSILGKYYFGQQGGQMGSQVKGQDQGQDQGGGIDYDSAACRIYDALVNYMGQIPFAERMSVKDLVGLMGDNRSHLVQEIAKGLKGAV